MLCKNARKFCEKEGSAGAKPFLSAKNNSWNCSHFSGQAVCSPLLERVCHSWDSFLWHSWHGCRRASPPLLASMFRGWGTSTFTCSRIVLESLAPRCPSIILIPRGILVETLDVVPFVVSQKGVQNSNMFFTPCFCRPPHDNNLCFLFCVLFLCCALGLRITPQKTPTFIPFSVTRS